MNVNEYLEKTFELSSDLPFTMGKIRPRVFCLDGESVSIQAGEHFYCSPRITQPTGYISVELGFPSFVDKRLLEYVETPENLLESVYGWTPVELVDEILSEHGGIDYERSLVEAKERERVLIMNTKNTLDEEGDE